MRRRQLITAVPPAVAGLAGCASAPDPGDDVETATWTPSSRPLEEYGCPPYDPGAEQVVCSHTADTDGVSVSLHPSARRAGASTTESLELTLQNDASVELVFNPYSWTVMRERGFAETGSWGSLGRRSQGDGRLALAPDDSHTWTVRKVVETIDETATLGPGTYLASIGVPDPRGEDWLDCVALFRLV